MPRSILLPHGRDAGPSKGYPPAVRERWKQSVILILVHVRVMSAIQRQKWPKDQNRLFILIYTLSNITWRLPQKRDFKSMTCPHQFMSIVQAMASLFRLLSCLYVIDFSWLMTSQKMYVYFTLLRDGTRRHRHGKFENQWLFPKNDWITLKCHWSTAAGRLEKKTWNNGNC